MKKPTAKNKSRPSHARVHGHRSRAPHRPVSRRAERPAAPANPELSAEPDVCEFSVEARNLCF